MKYEISHYENKETYSRWVEFSIAGHTRVTVSQELRSPVDFKPRLPEIDWSVPGSVDADFAEAMAISLKRAAELARQWEAETAQQAA